MNLSERPVEDKHHLLWPRREWTLRPEARKIRETPSLIHRIDREVHDYIHESTPGVPLLGFYTLRSVLEYFDPVGHPLNDIDWLCLSIDHATKSHPTHPIERDLGGLAIEVLTMQKNIILDGYVDPRHQIIDLGAHSER